MIIYRADQPPLLADYGILVPLLKGRSERVKEELEREFGSSVFCQDIPPKIEKADFEAVHTSEFLQRCSQTPDEVIQETFELINPDGSYHRYDPSKAKKPLSELVKVYERSCADSYLALLKASERGFAYYLGGGFHHALSNKGRGFCLFNDVIIAARKFQKDAKPGLVWIIDIDAHKGCGSAEITANDETILTLSIHMKEGWPLDSDKYDKEGKLNPWFIPSTIDIPVAKGEEPSYLEMLENGLNALAEKSSGSPVLCVVVDGSDPFEGDALPSANLLQLSREQCLKRNMLVYEFLKKNNIPQAYLISGGYGDQNWIIHYQFISQVLKDQGKFI